LPFCEVTSLPEVGIAPLKDQLPPAVHAVALVLDHPTVESAPETIDDGVSVMAAVGAPDAPLTATVAEACAVPPAPVQESV
jgi:hypothetical protein